MEDKLIKEFITSLCYKKKIYHSHEDFTQRWLDDGEIITLTVKQQTYTNVEFYVNGNPMRCIWFSQLSNIFILINKIELTSGKIRFKNGDTNYISNYEPEKFIDFVKDKQFKVSISQVARFNKDKISKWKTYGEAFDFIKELIGKGKIDEATDYLNLTTMYNLEEV